MKNKRGQFFLLAAVIISAVIISLAATSNRVVVQDNFQDVDDFAYDIEREVGEVLNYEVYTLSDGSNVREFADLVSEEIQDKDPDSEFVFIFGSNEEGVEISNYGKTEIGATVGDVEEGEFCVYSGASLVDAESIESGFYGCQYFQGNLFCSVEGWEDEMDGELSYEECVGASEESNSYVCNLCAGSCSNTVDSSCSGYNLIGGKNEQKLSCVGLGTSRVCVPISAAEYASGVGYYKMTAEELDGRDAVSINIGGVDVTVPISNYNQVHVILKKDRGNETYIESV